MPQPRERAALPTTPTGLITSAASEQQRFDFVDDFHPRLFFLCYDDLVIAQQRQRAAPSQHCDGDGEQRLQLAASSSSASLRQTARANLR